MTRKAKTWTAKIEILSTTPPSQRDIRLFPIEAVSIHDAARFAANQCALRLFGQNGQSGFLSNIEEDEPGAFLVTIGEWMGGGIQRGVTLKIILKEAVSA